MRVRNTIALFSTSLLCVILSAQPSPSQTRQRLAQNGASQPAPQQTETQPQVPRLTVPSDDVLLILIRAALVALDQANVTGNYTVLRDMAAPAFKQANSTEKLAQVFANVRRRNVDFAPILVIQPKLYRKAEITPQRMLRITGFFPTDPERIIFDLLFQPVQGRWQLFGISVNTVPSQRASVLEVAPQAAPAREPEEAAPESPAAEVAKKPKAPSTPSNDATSPSGNKADIRDRLDNPPSPPPEDEKPKEKSFWNPFAR